jgi:hypothetical protein
MATRLYIGGVIFLSCLVVLVLLRLLSTYWRKRETFSFQDQLSKANMVIGLKTSIDEDDVSFNVQDNYPIEHDNPIPHESARRDAMTAM